MAMSGSLFCHCMSETPYACLKSDVATDGLRGTPQQGKGLLIAFGQRTTGDERDSLPVAIVASHTRHLSANQQTGKKFTDLRTVKLAKNVGGADLKESG
jgi:hypothetical protein